jgi:serine/threonine protein kinase
MNELWGGPFSDDDSKSGSQYKKTEGLTRRLITDHTLRKDFVGGKKLAETVTELAGDEKEAFLDFASGMLQWLPEKRKTAKELLQHPIFDSLNKKRAQWQKSLMKFSIHTVDTCTGRLHRHPSADGMRC